MCHLIRLIRLTKAELWEARFETEQFPCYISIIDMERKANIKDNPLAQESDLEERDNYISINVVSDRDLKTTKINFEDFISEVDSLVEHMMLSNCHIFYNFVVPNIDTSKAKIYDDEELYGDREEQIADYVNDSIKNEAIALIEGKLNLSTNKISETYFCQG